MKTFKAFIKDFEAPQKSVKKNYLMFFLHPRLEREGLRRIVYADDVFNQK